jgi:hypothetical protein
MGPAEGRGKVMEVAEVAEAVEVVEVAEVVEVVDVREMVEVAAAALSSADVFCRAWPLGCEDRGLATHVRWKGLEKERAEAA